jgi:hypothetical protein
MNSGGGSGPINSTGRIINNATNVQPTAKIILDRERLRTAGVVSNITNI